MVGTQVNLDPRLGGTVILRQVGDDLSDALELFLRPCVLVIDGMQWSSLDAVRSGLIAKRRTFKSPFHGPDTPEGVIAALDVMQNEIETLVQKLYPNAGCTDRSASFRPMITANEPMHFDSYLAPVPILTAFVNVATTVRRYRIGPDFPSLVRDHPKHMQGALSEVEDPQNISYSIRDRTIRNKLPIDDLSPKHQIEFAPGAIWFCNTKLVSHEVIYGEGALLCSWAVPKSGAHSQLDYLRGIQ